MDGTSPQWDLLLKNARVFDGTGAPSLETDIAIRDGVIAAIAPDLSPRQAKQTLALEEKARSDLDAARRTVDLSTRSAFLGVLSGQGQVKALEAAETSSQSALEANQLGYQVGVRINIDVLNAQSQLFQTKRDLAQARYNVLLGSLRLRQASGELTPADLQAIDALLAR